MTASSSAYGPINKTTFGETSDGNVIRRMPNLVKFREDPDAMLVMSLEDYDEVTGKAAKSQIMAKDVVGKTRAVTEVKSAEEGLLVSLNQRGTVDLPFIADALRETAASRSLPSWAISFSSIRNQRPGRLPMLISPEMCGPSSKLPSRPAQITPAMPKPYAACSPKTCCLVTSMPTSAPRGYPKPTSKASPPNCSASIRRAFPSRILKKMPSGAWMPDTRPKLRLPLHPTTAPARANGCWLLELALNMKSPTIYDTFRDGDREERVVNQEETLAAREKQKLIKEQFRSWVFTEPERTERLVRLYNDTYNNLRPRLFDGGHLDFPGMNQNIRLRPHQNDAVWRGMSSGNTLLAHTVGAGKTFTMAATGMKMKQAGLIKKPMYVVPNHLLEQFSREFMQLYPNAKLLVASKEDLTAIAENS